MKHLSIMIKPSSSLCNLNCAYCFYRDEAKHREVPDRGFMDEKTLDNIIKKAFSFAEKSVSIVFQGGEPTLIGLDFYKKVVEKEREYNQKNLTVFNSVQTNAYALDSAFAPFFHDNGFLVGVSLDGNKDINDFFRASASGGGSFSSVQANIRALEKSKVEFNILSVVTKQTACHAEQAYNFFKKSGYKYLQFIPCLDLIENKNEKPPFALGDKEYGDFLIRLFDLWYADLIRGEAPSIRLFDNIILMLRGKEPEICSSKGVCSEQYVFEADGSVYPCDFYATDEYLLGNINRDSFEDFDSKRSETGFIARSQNKNGKCTECEFFPFCRNGCYRERTETNLNRFCESYRRFYSHALPILSDISRKLY